MTFQGDDQNITRHLPLGVRADVLDHGHRVLRRRPDKVDVLVLAGKSVGNFASLQGVRLHPTVVMALGRHVGSSVDVGELVRGHAGSIGRGMSLKVLDVIRSGQNAGLGASLGHGQQRRRRLVGERSGHCGRHASQED